MLEAAEKLAGHNENLRITGIDLAGMSSRVSPDITFLKFIETSFENFSSEIKFDLITCFHGLHYIGDKLAFLVKAVSMLKPNGIFLANLDLDNFKFEDDKPANRMIAKNLRENRFEFDSKKHLLT